MNNRLLVYSLSCISAFLAFSLFMHNKQDFFCMLLDGDAAYFVSEMQRFQTRNEAVPSIVVTGGSDVREAWNAKEAQNFFSQRGLNFFLLAHSSSGNSIDEQIQTITHLKINKQDLVVMNISPVDMLNNNLPYLRSFSENLIWYKWSLKSKNYKKDWREVSRLYFADFLPYYRKRLIIRKLFSLRKWPITQEITQKHLYGDKPQSTEEFSRKFDVAIKNKIGEDDSFLSFSQHAKFISILKAHLKNNLVLVETPRNPLYKKIISPSFQKIAIKHSSNQNIIILGDGINLVPEDYYDFNHLHSGGRNKFMKVTLLKIESTYKDQIIQ